MSLDTRQLAIGVFDSGMGGLTVLRAVRSLLPDESYIYLGDTARLPYGTKSPETVKQYAIQMSKILVDRHIKALVIACNTATTAALPHLQHMLPDIPVIGVVAPGAMAAVRATSNQRIAVLATETTVASEAYQTLILQQLPQAHISPKACSVLVALAEDGMVDNPVAKEALKHYLNGIHDVDTIVLGCTHFPVFRKTLADMVDRNVAIVDSAEATAWVLKELLQARDELNTPSEKIPSVRYLVTDSVQRFRTVGALFLGHPLDAQDVELVEVQPELFTRL